MEELAGIIHQTKPGAMNEVNANFNLEDLIGLFANEARSPNNKLLALMTARHFKEKGLELPLYVYDTKEGKLSNYNPSTEEIKGLIEQVNSSVWRDLFERGLIGVV